MIQCEGLTEFHYLDGLRRDPRFAGRYAVTPKPGKGNSAVVTLELAIAERDRQRNRGEDYDEVWCVLDVEHDAHAQTLTEAIRMAEEERFIMFLSNPCFEVWLLAHFERKVPYLPNGDAAKARLNNEHWKSTFDTKYKESDAWLYAKLASRLPDALDNAEWVMDKHHGRRECRKCNSSTEVYKLVRRLLPPE